MHQSQNRPGVKFTINAAFFQEIKEDHQQLNAILERLDKLAHAREAVENHKRGFTETLSDLRDQIAFHFTLEEAYGYFEDALEGSPWLHDAAGSLRGEHAALYLTITEIADKAHEALAAADADWPGLADTYLEFRHQLRSHETSEMKLILDAMQRDLGTGD